jgi:dihydrofolate reductase
MRRVGTHLYGRRMYETMVFWEDPPDLASRSAAVRDFAQIWRSAEKIVYSKTLQTPTSGRTRIEREFDPQSIGQLKEAAVSDITVGGAELAGEAIRAGLVDEYHLFLQPVIVGAGKAALPERGSRLSLELLGERRFDSGAIYLHYRAR